MLVGRLGVVSEVLSGDYGVLVVWWAARWGCMWWNVTPGPTWAAVW